MFGFLSSFRAPFHTPGQSDISSHTAGTAKGEEWVQKRGREDGRQESAPHRTARDSTSVSPEIHGPIDPRMPNIPPA
ncbi:MAG TPA: hypothetical protein VHE81_00070 [Lacipirellulaceae bacterium]|nr:hypothetical protein [Lacipirellulaceae bacterium]